MKEFKGTKGPWVRGGDSPLTYSDCVYDSYGSTILEIHSPENFDHDANLIAAAPELLEALQILCIAASNIEGEHVIGWDKLIEKTNHAYSVIAKALGESK